jgi:proteasome lid subunit RPN8/RPN11
MAGAPSSLEGDESNFAEPSRSIDCPVSVLQSIRSAVLERFNSTPHGGDEVTGVLFGTRTGEEVRVTAFCPVADESALSRSTALTEVQRAVTAVIAAAHSHEELAGLEPLGWFRSHPRCDLNLTDRDIEIANTLFPQPWQIGLVMRPGNSAVTRARFYYRETEGAWTEACAVREFTLPAAELQPGPEAASETGLSTDVQEPELPAEVESFLPSAPRKRVELRRASFRWPLALIAVAGLAGGIYWYTQSQALSLGVSDSRGQLRIAWDRTARPVRNAKTGHLEIVDGGQKLWMELNAQQLQVGNVTCQRRSNDVTVKLVVQSESGAQVEDSARFVGLGAPPASVSAENQAAGGNAASRPANPPELVVPVPVERAAPEAPANAPPKFQEPRTEANRVAPVVPEPTPEITPPPAEMARSAPASVMTPPLVRAEPPAETPAAPRPANSTAAAPAQAASAPARVAPAPRVPAAGRVIWIGRLQKNQPVTISGKNCSVGTLIGELPGRAFRFSVSPGDLSADGIVLYTSNLQYANSVVEPPGAENGWNKTVYTWNPKYASDVSVEEAPSAQNGWSRIKLRSKNPKISVLVIDWTAVN